MIRKIKFGKIFAVAVLSVLVWVWADLASDEEYTVYSATISIVPSQQNLWVSFEDGASVSIREIVLKGPAARIAQLNTRLKQGEPLQFDFDAAQAGMSEPDSYPLILKAFLQSDKEIKRMSLRVESCKPEQVQVTVQRLEKRQVPVECRDETNNPVTAEINPPRVNVLLPEDWAGAVAYVQLSDSEKKGARLSPITKTPYVPLPDDRKAVAEQPVAVTIPSVELPKQEIRPRVGYVLSHTLQGKYEVDVSNFTELYVPFTIQATPTAKFAYENQDFQLLLVIKDTDVSDVASDDYRRRALEYNFPAEFVSKGEIKLVGTPREAQFRLIEKPSPERGPTPLGSE